MKALVILAIAIVCAIIIIAIVVVVGGEYQKVLFDEYMEDLENPPRPSPQDSQNIPKIDILP